MLLAYDEAAAARRRRRALRRSSASRRCATTRRRSGWHALGEAVDRFRAAALGDRRRRPATCRVRESSPPAADPACARQRTRVPDQRRCRALGLPEPAAGADPPGCRQGPVTVVEMTGGGQALLAGAVGIDRPQHAPGTPLAQWRSARQALPDNLLPTPSLWGSVLRWHRSGWPSPSWAARPRRRGWRCGRQQRPMDGRPATASLLTADGSGLAAPGPVLHRDAPASRRGSWVSASTAAPRWPRATTRAGRVVSAQLLAAGEPAQQGRAEMAPGGEVFVAWPPPGAARPALAGSWGRGQPVVPAGAARIRCWSLPTPRARPRCCGARAATCR